MLWVPAVNVLILICANRLSFGVCACPSDAPRSSASDRERDTYISPLYLTANSSAFFVSSGKHRRKRSHPDRELVLVETARIGQV